MMMRFLLPITAFVRIGFGQKRTESATAMNMAFKDNMARALIGTYPDFTLDYALVRISDGIFVGGGSEAVSTVAKQDKEEDFLP